MLYTTSYMSIKIYNILILYTIYDILNVNEDTIYLYNISDNLYATKKSYLYHILYIRYFKYMGYNIYIFFA